MCSLAWYTVWRFDIILLQVRTLKTEGTLRLKLKKKPVGINVNLKPISEESSQLEAHAIIKLAANTFLLDIAFLSGNIVSIEL